MKTTANLTNQSRTNTLESVSSTVAILIVSLLLLLLVGPLFSPVPRYLMSVMAIETATAVQVVLFVVPFAIILALMLRWMRANQRTIADLGWRQPTTKLAVVLGTLLGLLWGALGITGYLQFNPEADLFTLNLLRVFTMLMGAGGAVLEDLITRGFVMGEMKRLNAPTWLQIIFSSLLFALYHTIWGFNTISFVFSLIYGLLLAGLFVLGKRSLTPVILGHSLALLVGEPFLTLSLMEAVKLAGG